MQRGNDDALARSSFSFGGGHEGGKVSGSGSSQTKTAAQLRKLQRLVETLVVRELERGEGPLAAVAGRQDGRERHELRQGGGAPNQQRRSQQVSYHRSGGDSSAGGGASRRPTSKVAGLSFHDSDASSLDTSLGGGGGSTAAADADGLAAAHTYGMYGTRGPSHSTMAAGRGEGRGGASLGAGLNGNVHLQVAALQSQLAMLGEQLNSAYRAAEGLASPHANGGSATAAAAVAAAANVAPPPVMSASGLRAHAFYGSSGAATGSTDLGTSAGQSSLVSAPARSSSPLAARPGGPLRPHFQAPAFASTGVTGTARAGSPLPARMASDSTGGGVGISGGVDPLGLDALSGSSGAAGAGTLGSLRLQQAAEERAAREATAREDERLRNWIQELRAERRRLEDRILGGDNSGAANVQQLRDELEKLVLALSRQRDQLAAELSDLGVSRAANMQLTAQVEALEAALAAEGERVVRYKEVRPALEGRLAEVSASLEALTRQHVAAVDALAQDRDAALSKARRSSKRAAELEAALGAANVDIRRLQDEVRSHVMTMAEMRAKSDVMQSASQQMQAGMEAQAKETATRLAAVQAQLEASQSEGAILRRQLDTAQHATTALRDQLKDAQARWEAQAAERDRQAVERDRLASSLAEEQRATAAARQHAESLAAQLKAGEEARADAARAAAAQLEAVRRQHAADLASTQKQYESQLAVAEKQYLLLQRQYDAGLASSDMAAEAAVSLRRERDALWAEAQSLRTELEETRREKADLSSQLAALRSEVRATMEEVARDRDARLAASAAQGETLAREVRTEAERRVAMLNQEYEAKLSNLTDMAEKFRAESSEANRQVDKCRATISHLKDQVRDLLLSRDAAERELASERAFNEELNRILTTIRAEQQQQHQIHHQQHSSGLRLASPAD